MFTVIKAEMLYNKAFGVTRYIPADPKPRTLGILLILADTGRSPNAGPVLAHRLRRWPNINAALDQRLVFASMRAGSNKSQHVVTNAINNVPMIKLTRSVQEFTFYIIT